MALYCFGIVELMSESQHATLVFYLGWTGTAEIKAGAFALLLVSSVVAAGGFGSAALLGIRNLGTRDVFALLLALLWLVAAGLALVIAFWFAVFTAGTTYVGFASPGSGTSVLIAEDGLGNGLVAQNVWGPVYEVKGSYSADDFYRPVSNGTFTAEWSSDEFILAYQFESSTHVTHTVTIRLSS